MGAPNRPLPAGWGAFAPLSEVADPIVDPRSPKAPESHEDGKQYSVRRECLDHVLVLGETHLRRLLQAYVRYFNTERPHQGLGQRIPDRQEGSSPQPRIGGRVRAVQVLGGLHHAYRRVA